MSEHTPTPWEYVPATEHHGPYITSEFGSTICDCYLMSHPSEPSIRNGGKSKPIHFLHEMADPNAAFIVNAVNAHDTLVNAIEAVRAIIIEGAETGFNPRSGDWADRLFRSQGLTYDALKLAGKKK